MLRKDLVLFIVSLVFASLLSAQPTNSQDVRIPISRQGFHDKILKEKELLLASDGRKDNEFEYQNNPDIGRLATEAINHQVEAIRFRIETDAKIDNRLKTGYLVGLNDILRQMRIGWRKKEVSPSHFAQIFSLYSKLIEVNTAKESMIPFVQYFSYDIAYTATLPRIFEENPEYSKLKDLLLLKYSNFRPEKTFLALSRYPESGYADSIIKTVGRKYPSQLFSYAQASDKLGHIIRSIQDDDFVKTVVGLSKMNSGQVYYPFLDNLVKGKVTIAELDAAKDDRLQYYRLLVKTKLDYNRRAIRGDTAVGFDDLTDRLKKKASDEFVNEINALHESPDAVRYKCLQELTPQELYYAAVLTDGLIYTSSYVSGIFPLMMRKMNNRGDSLLLSVSFDHYRKFISQAAGYNTLKTFFNGFNKQDATNLMTTFVSKLEKSTGLEDGVDVADSYASVFETLPDIAKQMLRNIKVNYDRNVHANNARGVAIYNILYKLFLSANPANGINLTKELGIPPVYDIPFKSFTNEKGEVITQMFFYGDEDGMTDFDIFVRTFSNDPKWKVE